jgi:hypothetical protein
MASWRLAQTSTEAVGFSSPGNSGNSEEMKEAGRPHEVADSDDATRRHLFAEKDRFAIDKTVGGRAAMKPLQGTPKDAVNELGVELGRRGAAAARSPALSGDDGPTNPELSQDKFGLVSGKVPSMADAPSKEEKDSGDSSKPKKNTKENSKKGKTPHEHVENKGQLPADGYEQAMQRREESGKMDYSSWSSYAFRTVMGVYVSSTCCFWVSTIFSV